MRDDYNLDMILAVGYIYEKGFVLNDERLCNPREFGADYWNAVGIMYVFVLLLIMNNKRLNKK